MCPVTDDNAVLKISQEESRRISILKVWLSIMVVFIHAHVKNVNFAGESIGLKTPDWLAALEYCISEVVARSAVPAFFLLASYFLYRKPYSWKTNLAKKSRSLLIPFVLINAFWVLFLLVSQHIPAMKPFFSKSEHVIGNWGWGEWMGAFGWSWTQKYPLAYPLWFLRDLFVLNVLAVIVEWIVDRSKAWSLCIFIPLWLVVKSSPVVFLSIHAISFWGIGCCLAKRKISLSSLDRYKVLLGIAYPCLVLSCLVLGEASTTGRLVPYRLCLLAGVAFWFVFATKFKDGPCKDFLLRASKFAFPLYLFHELNLTILRKSCMKILPHSAFVSAVQYFAVPMAIILFCLLLSWFFERVTPTFYKVLTGGRNR